MNIKANIYLLLIYYLCQFDGIGLKSMQTRTTYSPWHNLIVYHFAIRHRSTRPRMHTPSHHSPTGGLVHMGHSYNGQPLVHSLHGYFHLKKVAYDQSTTHFEVLNKRPVSEGDDLGGEGDGGGYVSFLIY